MIWLLCGYMWLFIHRPFEVWPWLGDLHVERVYVLCTLAFWLIAPKKIVSNRLNVAFFLLVAAVLLSWALSPYRAMGTKVVEDYLKVVLFYVLVMTSVRGERDLRILVTAFLVSIGLYVAHSFWEYLNGRHVYRMGTARMIGVDSSFSDPNTFAATILYALPMVRPLWRNARNRRVKLMLVAFVGLAITCILLTGSRTGLIGLLILSFLAWLVSKKRFLFVVLLAVSLPTAWRFLPEDRQDRYLTLLDPSRGPQNAEDSAESRYVFFWIGLDLWKQRPLTGFGPYGFAPASRTGLQAHTLYSQVLSETGTIGVVGLLIVLAGFMMNWREARRLYRSVPTESRDLVYFVSQSAVVTVFLLLVLGVGGHNLFRYSWLWMGAFQAIALDAARRRFKSDRGNEQVGLPPPVNEPVRLRHATY